MTGRSSRLAGDAHAWAIRSRFERLPKAVARPYRGPHGYESEIWPIPYHLYADPSDDRVRRHVSDTASELEKSFGSSVGELQRRLDRYSKRVWIQLGATIILFAIIFALHGKLSLFESVLLGVGANLLTMVLFGTFQVRTLRWPGSKS